MRLAPAVCKILLIINLLVSAAQAEEEADDLLNLSLEDLLKVKVYVGSRNEQTLSSTPGVVRVFTAQDIQQSGFETLQELLRYVPGIQLSESKNGHTNIWMRGVQSRNNSKVLLLVDGVPQNDSFYGNFNIDMMLPLASVDRVEVLNGPGGVTYGANSFVGVINISSKQKGRSINTSYGQQVSYSSAESTEQADFKRVYGEADYHHEDYGSIYVYGDYYKEEGFQPQYNREGEFYSRDTDAHNQMLMLRYFKDGFSANVTASKYDYPYRYTKSERWQGYEKEPLSLSMTYQGDFFQHSISSQAYIRQFDFSRPRIDYDSEGNVDSIRDTSYDSSMAGAEAIVHWNVPEDHDLDIGVSYQRDWLRESTQVRTDYLNGAIINYQVTDQLVTKPDREDTATFIQYQWLAHPMAQVTIGGRYDYLSDFDNQSNYRIGLTGNRERFFYKLLYGTSFRVPTYREYLKKYNDQYTSINPLEPEDIETLEFSVGYGKSIWQTELTLYQNTYKNFIKEINIYSVDGIVIGTIGDPDEYAFNFEEIIIKGGELTLQLQPISTLEISASVSKIFSAKEDPGQLNQVVIAPEPIPTTTTSLQQLSDTTAGLMIDYQPNNRWLFGADASYYSKRKVSASYQQSSAVKNPDNADSLILVGIHMRVKLPKNIHLKLKVNNLLDKDIYSPNYDPESGYDVQWPRRSIAATIGLNF